MFPSFVAAPFHHSFLLSANFMRGTCLELFWNSKVWFTSGSKEQNLPLQRNNDYTTKRLIDIVLQNGMNYLSKE